MKSFIEIDTPLDPGTLLFHEMRGKEELSRLFEYELELLVSERDRTIKLDEVLGKVVTVKLELPNDKVRSFSGYVTRIALAGMHGRFLKVRAKMQPWLWLLTRTTNCRIFQEKSVPDILKEVFATHAGVADVKFELTETYTPWEYCVQYRETDFNFVSRLMEHEGIYYFFKHEEGRHTLVVADSYSAHAVANGGEIPFIEPEKIGRVERDHVSEWSVTHELQPGKYALTDYDFTKPSVDLQVKTEFKRENAMAEYEVFEYPGDYIDRGDGQLYVRARIEEVQSKFERVEGKTNARALAAGTLFTLTSHTLDDQNTEYLVVSTEIELKSAEHEAVEGTGATYACRFAALNSKQPFRAERLTPKPVVQGPQTAITVGPAGEDIHTDKFGRVKVQFHWDRYGKKDDKSSCWIRVSQNWGGKGWGGMFIPHTGQEVIVQFLEGDPDMPLITGRVYNAENMPPVALPAGKTQSIIRDHGGNEIKMEGDGGTQQIKMFSPSGNTTFAIGAPGSPGDGIEGVTDLFFKLTIGQDWKSEIKGAHHEHVWQDKNITVTGKKVEEIWADSKKIIRANATEAVWGNKDSTVKGYKTDATMGYERKWVLAFLWTLIAGMKTEIILGQENKIVSPSKNEMICGTAVKLMKGEEFKKMPGFKDWCGGAKFWKAQYWKRKASTVSESSSKKDEKIDGDDHISCGSYLLESKGEAHIHGKPTKITSESDLSVIAGGDMVLRFGSLKLNGQTVDMKDGTLKVG